MVSGDLLPFCGGPVGGAGLRTWGLGEGLRHKGHNVIYGLPEAAQGMTKNGDFPYYIFYDPLNFDACIKETSPDVIIFQSWTQVPFAGNYDGPVVLDFHGPTMLEVQYHGGEYALRKRIKLYAIRRADFFTCAGEYQRHYFWAWLMAAGIKVEMDTLRIVPVGLSPELPELQKEDDIIFVYGGTFLPWQNPQNAILKLVEILKTKDRGLFRFYGGDSVLGKDSGGKFTHLLNILRNLPHVEIRGHLSHSKLISEYLKAGVALDLMERNPERELAFTTRTVEYLWCGLPVIYNNYAELSSHIQEYEAGWVIDPDDGSTLTNVVEKILDNGYDLKAYSLNAQRLVKERFTWDRVVLPLALFCSSPKRKRPLPKINWSIREFSQILRLEGRKFLGKLRR